MQDPRQHVLTLLETEPIYPGNGLPPRPNEDRPGLTPFGRLAMGQLLGHSSILIYDHNVSSVQPALTDMIGVEGDDLDACQLVVTLHPPRVIPRAFCEVTARLDQQNITGEQTNAEVSICDFPGEKKPIRWPPLEALVEFGVGGCSSRVVVDYLNGVTLSVVASYVRVCALVSQTHDIRGTNAAYYLASHIGPGFAECHAQRTIFIGDVKKDNESDVFDVPKFAKVAVLMGTRSHHHKTPTLTKGWIRFWQSPDGTNGVGDVFVSDHETRVEVPNAAQYFSVFNESGHEMKMSVIFELAL
jgi:hypothetical protein